MLESNATSLFQDMPRESEKYAKVDVFSTIKFRLNDDKGILLCVQISSNYKKEKPISIMYSTFFVIVMINVIRIPVYACMRCKCKCFATDAGSEVGE